MAAEYFNKIADEVLLAAEQMQSLLTTGDLIPADGASNDDSGGDIGDDIGGAGGGASSSSSSGSHEFDMSDLDFDGMSEQEIQELLGEEIMQNNPLQGIAEDVTKNIMAGQAQPENPMEHFHAFRSAINWSEKFIIGLICFQIVMFLLCLFVSRKDRGLAPRVCLLVFIGVVVRSAEWLNAQGVQHWESFATQDYFDKRGIFIGIMLCAPLLLDSLMMLLFFMKEASKLLIQVKRSEIKTKYKQKNNNNKGGGKKNAGRAKTKKQD